MQTLTPGIGRRRFLLSAAAATVGGCSSSSGAPAPSAAPCSSPATGPGVGSCQLENVLLRVPGGARLEVNQAMLTVLSDNTAAIVARDERGLYARSAICTHACCVVTVCADSDCAPPPVRSAACAKAPPSPLLRSGAAFLCPCHGSAFRADGTVIVGPASSPLPSLGLQLDGDDAVVDVSRSVDPSLRV